MLPLLTVHTGELVFGGIGEARGALANLAKHSPQPRGMLAIMTMACSPRGKLSRSQEILLRGGDSSTEVRLLVGRRVLLILLLVLSLLGLGGGSAHGPVDHVVILTLVLVLATLGSSSLLGRGEVVLANATDASLLEVVIHSLLLASLALFLRASEFGNGVVLVGRVGGIDGGHVHGLVRDLGELFLLLLFLELTLFLFGTFKGFLLGTLQSRLLDGLLQAGGSLPELPDVHDEVGNDKQDQRDDKSDTSAELDGHLGRSVREDEDGNDEG